MLSRIRNLFSDQSHQANEAFSPPDDGLYQVVSDASRCVQCGICGFNCPVGIEVREYARRGQNVTDSNCINCGECIAKCPRGTLRWGSSILVREDKKLEVDPDSLPIILHLQVRDFE
jgi:ferredoxin